MFRIFVVLLLALVIAGGVAYSAGWLDEYVEGTFPTPPPPPTQQVVFGDLLYSPTPLAALPESPKRTPFQVVVEPCHVVIRDKLDISSPKDGHLWIVGTRVDEKNTLPLNPPRPLLTAKLFDGKEVKIHQYRPLEEGDIVEYEQVVAVVDYALAQNDYLGKAFKVKAAQADHKGTAAILDEVKKRLDNLIELRQRSPGAVSVIDMGDAQVAVAKYASEKDVKMEAISTAKSEEDQAKIILEQHILKCELPGKSVVKKIYKASREGIKAQESILQLYNLSRLRVEGAVDSQYVATLRKYKDKARCYLEPSVELDPALDMTKVHAAEVTSVAVCADDKHFVSGSEDHTICVWERGRTDPVLAPLDNKSAVRVVACSPNSMHVVAGCADGSVRVWDLTKPKEPVVVKELHRGPVAALAFSPDGTYVASGGEDNAIVLWEAASGKVVYTFDSDHGVDDAHQGTVTALHFTPQCKLVSAARDNSLRVWQLHKNGAKLEFKIQNRGGAVSQLGVSSDGRFMLFDKAKSLQLRSVADGKTVWSVLDNLSGTNPFETLALFSPDGSLMLAGSAGEGRLHLWKTPTPSERAFQVRELVSKDRSAITSAAFFPGGKRFAVTGSKEG